MVIPIFSILIILSLLLLFFSQIPSQRFMQRFFFVCGLFVYCSMLSLRGLSGSDTYVYSGLYSDYSYDAFLEPGISLVYGFANSLSLGFVSILMLQSCLVFASLIFLSQGSGTSSVMFYILLFGINIDFSTLRQSIALHLAMILFRFMPLVLASLAASFFHLSALVIPFASIRRIKLSYYHMIIPLVLAVPAVFFLTRYLSDSEGAAYLFRQDLSWSLQYAFILAFLILKKYSAPIIAVSFITALLPIGYRVFALIFPFATSPSVGKRSELYSSLLMLIFAVPKLVSYSHQSLSNDGINSVVLHFGSFVL